MLNSILYPALAIGAIGLFFGLVLAIASIITILPNKKPPQWGGFFIGGVFSFAFYKFFYVKFSDFMVKYKKRK